MKTHVMHHTRRGFALVVTLSLLILLAVLAVGMLSLSAVSLRSSGHGSALTSARANARMALMIAIGELQTQAGPDQRVTATSSLTNATENPNWTGVWRADQPASAPAWLVSGSNPDPSLPLPADSSVSLLAADPADPGSKDLRAPLVIATGNTPGGYAWWVGDEGVKARIDLAKPKAAATDHIARLSRSQSPLEPGLTQLGTDFAKLGPDAAVDKTRLITMETVGIASIPDLPQRYFHDLTTGGFGLPVNVAQGRLKTDLSLIFDSSQQGRPYANRCLGATGNNSLPSQGFTVNDPAKFYLSDTLRTRISQGVDPNWGNLWNYANSWKIVANGQIDSMTAAPVPVENDIRHNNMIPYTGAGSGKQFDRDIQHTNSPVNPVLSLVQLGFRIKARPTGVPDRFQLQMQVKPVIGIWNPYNVALQPRVYLFDCGFFPWLRYGTGTSTGGQSSLPADTDPRGDLDGVSEIWLRDQWAFVEDAGAKGKTRLTMRTQMIDLQPGEFRLLSVPNLTTMVRESPLTSAWSEEGAYEMNLIKDNGSPAIVSGTLGNGTPRFFWLGDMLLDDTQKKPPIAGQTAASRYPAILTANATSAWFTLKSGAGITGNPGGSMARYADFWNNGSGEFTVPERILSGAVSSTVTSKAKYRITDLAAAGGYEHLATWSFFLRTSTQIEDVNADQRLRGWIDSNPRALAINPRWEGAVAPGGERQGWNFTSAYMGGAHGTGLPAKQVGDGGFGNRGLVAEAGEGGENIEPQIGDPARYKGLGGASNTAVGGQPHVMIYDIPRSPLVSLGQFQHANLTRYSHEPGFVVGNSYADLKIPLDATVANNFTGFTGHHVVDISHEINGRLWDDFHFSTLGVDYMATGGSSLDSAYAYSGAAFPLAHPRITFHPGSEDKSIDQMISDAADTAPEAVSARIRIGGAFNINSTSKTAWKALLASMAAAEFPRIDPANPTAAPVWEAPGGVRFNRFGHVATNTPYRKGGDGSDPSFWLGWREIDADELDALAEEIVNEVRARGPFRSLAEFVNRNPGASDIGHQRKGALQAAIDKTINAALPDTISDAPAQKPNGPFSDATDGESQTLGQAGYLMQGDVLQSLAPILQPRSDYFRIRAYGEARDSSGKVTARAWCEAFVQRDTAYVDPSDRPETRSDDPAMKPANKTFGRRFGIVSFRWLSPSEVPTPS
jgi:hypothetical protein